MKIFYYLYVIPTLISILYFSALKIQDISTTQKSYSKDKFSFKNTIGLCFIPIFNWALALMSLKMIISSIF